eukprot:m.58066 g.58066  ORF g.58066 m.58066 type:complete len:458 (+) comp7850_c0_seq5:57-1430(+)
MMLGIGDEIVSEVMPLIDVDVRHSAGGKVVADIDTGEAIHLIEPHRDSTKASVSACSINLINTIIGAGVLSLPYAFSLVGYVGGILLLIVNVMVADYSLHLLLKAAKTCGRDTYESIADYTFGRKGVALVSMATILLNIGAATAYIVIIGDTLPEFIYDVAPTFLATEWARLWATGVVTLIFLIPLSLLRNIALLGYTSSLSVICVVVFVFVMIGIAASDEGKPTDESAKLHKMVWSQNIFRAFSLLAFAFTCHTTMFPIYLSLEKRSVSRMMKAIHYAMIVCFSLYVSVGLCGYFLYGQLFGGIKGDVLVNIGENESFVVTTIVRIMYIVSIISTYPLAFPPIRQALSGLFFKNSHPTHWSIGLHLSVTFFVILLTFLFGNFIPVLEFVFGLTGATAGVTLVYILPTAFCLKLSYMHRMTLSIPVKLLLLCLLIFGIALGALSTVYTIVDFVKEGE